MLNEPIYRIIPESFGLVLFCLLDVSWNYLYVRIGLVLNNCPEKESSSFLALVFYYYLHSLSNVCLASNFWACPGSSLYYLFRDLENSCHGHP